jgi:Cell wall-associated hydrolase.
LRALHCPPINLIVYKGFYPAYAETISYLEGRFPLRCFQRLSVGNLATQRCSYSETTGTPGIPSSQSSRTRDESSQISTIVQDRDRTVLRRSEPSSRTTLTGEQPDPWDLLQPQDVMSRHRDLLLSALTIPSSPIIIVKGASLLGKLYIVQ